MKPLVLFLTLCALLNQAFSEDAAAPAEKNAIYKDGGRQTIELLLRNAGIVYDENEKENAFAFELEGYHVTLDGKPTDLRIYAGFEGKEVPLTRVNEWNRQRRFARAFLDEKGHVYLTSDLDCTGGVTMADMQEFVVFFGHNLRDFNAFMR